MLNRKRYNTMMPMRIKKPTRRYSFQQLQRPEITNDIIYPKAYVYLNIDVKKQHTTA